MRVGELIGLEWNCIDFENGLIHVNKQLVQTRKKGQEYHFGSLKNGKTRTIAPAPYVMDVLTNRKIDQEMDKSVQKVYGIRAISPIWYSLIRTALIYLSRQSGKNSRKYCLMQDWNITESMFFAILLPSIPLSPETILKLCRRTWGIILQHSPWIAMVMSPTR